MNPATPQNIVFFGDSLTAGYGLKNPKDESVPGLIQQKIDQDGLAYRTRNDGLSGDTSGGGLTRLDYWLSQPVAVFVLELGINDLLRRLPPARTEANLDAIISKVKTAHPDARLALMGMRLPAFLPGAPEKNFNVIFERLADKHQPAYVPFYLESVAGKRELNLPDGLHPNAAGYRVIADRIWPVIRPLLSI